MYEKFYGLRERAFNLTPDPAFLFLNKRNKEGLEHVLYGIERREGFAVIVGDVGTGKTTLCWAILERLEKRNVRTALIQNPMLSDTDILRSILQDLGVRPRQDSQKTAPDGDAGLEVFDTAWMQGMSKKELMDRLNSFLAERVREDVFTVLIIDESQNLSMEMLEQLRLLSNLETAKKKLLQIIFAGQMELDAKLSSPALRQLNQRISVRFETKTLSKADTERYIRHRLAMAGGSSKLRFGQGFFKATWRYSRGYPRLINLICDRAFLAAYSERSLVITRKFVRKAAFSLKGKEDVFARRIPGWLGRLMPFSAVLLLLLLLSFVAWKEGSERKFSPSLPASPVAAAPPEANWASDPPLGNRAPESPIPAQSTETQGGQTKPAQPPQHEPRSDAGLEGKEPTQAPATGGIQPGGGFCLQVHSFRTNDLAQRARRPLEAAGFAAFIKYFGNNGRPGWFAVFVGPFEDLETAKEKAAELRNQGLAPVIRGQ